MERHVVLAEKLQVAHIAGVQKALAQERKEQGTIEAIRQGRWDRAFVDALEARCAN
ncbi:hypothetical protein [Bradyrhizobium sp. USDA 4459]